MQQQQSGSHSRPTRLGQGELPDPQSLLGQLWKAIRDFLMRLTGQREKGLDQQVRDLIIAGRRTPESLEGSGWGRRRCGTAGVLLFGPARQFQQTTRTKLEQGRKVSDALSPPRKAGDGKPCVNPSSSCSTPMTGWSMRATSPLMRWANTSRKLGDKLDGRMFHTDSMLAAAISQNNEANVYVQVLTDRRDSHLNSSNSQYATVIDNASKLTQAEERIWRRRSATLFLSISLRPMPLECICQPLQDYVQHVWDKSDNRGKPQYGAFLSRFDSDPSAFQKRTHATFFDGLMAGLTPKTLDAFKLVGVNGRQINTAVSHAQDGPAVDRIARA